MSGFIVEAMWNN